MRSATSRKLEIVFGGCLGAGEAMVVVLLEGLWREVILFLGCLVVFVWFVWFAGTGETNRTIDCSFYQGNAYILILMLILHCTHIAVASIRERKQGSVSGLCQPCRRSRLDRAADQCGRGGVVIACGNDCMSRYD